MDRIKLLSGFTLGRILLLLLILQGGILYGQDVTISQLTGGIAGSPLVAGATDQAILGIEFSKAAGGTNELESIVIALTEDPAGRFTNVRLCRSDNNNSFDGADLANTVGTVA